MNFVVFTSQTFKDFKKCAIKYLKYETLEIEIQTNMNFNPEESFLKFETYHYGTDSIF